MSILTVPSCLTQIKQARIAMLIDHPFFGGPSLRLDLLADEDLPATMGTDGTHLFFNPSLLAQRQWSAAEYVAVVCHEVLHCVSLHHLRRQHRNPLLFNIACDFAINLLLKECGLHLPGDEVTKAMLGWQDQAGVSGHLLDYQYTGWAAERIYDDLQQDTKLVQACQSAGADFGMGWNLGEVRDAPRGQTEIQKTEWKQATRQAAQLAQSRGLLPARLASLVETWCEPTVDWRALLREFVQTSIDRTDYTWNRPNTRFVAHGLYVPRLWGEQTPSLAVAIDTSGSTASQTVRMAFASELAALAEDIRPRTLYVLHADAAVHKIQEFGQGDEVHITEFFGNGGTDFRPVFDHLHREGLDAEIACLIYLTDMEGPFPETAPDYPVLWASVTDVQAPFGKTVKVRLNAENHMIGARLRSGN